MRAASAGPGCCFALSCWDSCWACPAVRLVSIAQSMLLCTAALTWPGSFACSSQEAHYRMERTQGTSSFSSSETSQRVAFFYTGQARAFSVRWQHANHLTMLVDSAHTLYNKFRVHSFFVLPEDSWYTNTTRNILLDLPTMQKIVTYEPRGSILPAHNRSDAPCHEGLSLGFNWPPEQLSRVESRVKLLWRSSRPFSPILLQGLQLHIAALTSFDVERMHGTRFDAFVRLRMDSFLYSPWRMPSPLGLHANATLIAQDSRVQDFIFHGGRQVLEWISGSRAYTSCSSGGSPFGVVNHANARAAGIEHIIAGPGGASIALLRTNRALRCVRIDEGRPSDDCREEPCCDDLKPSAEKERSYAVTEAQPPFSCSMECTSCATACRTSDIHGAVDTIARLTSSVGIANFTLWVEAGEPVRTWNAHIRCPAVSCDSCESAVAMRALRGALRHHGYRLEGDPTRCPNEKGVSIYPPGYEKAMNAQHAALMHAQPGSEVGIQFRIRERSR